jgi:hypothetical protein
MLASGFMNAKGAERCLNRSQLIAVFSALMALFRVHRFNKVQALVVHRFIPDNKTLARSRTALSFIRTA